MDSAAIAGRSGKAVWLVQIVRWTTADFTLRLTNGGFIDWGVERFLQRDPTYGVIASLPTFDDGIDSQTTRANISLYPESHEALFAMADRKHQGSIIEVFDCALDADTGLLWGEPDRLFRGFYDFATPIFGETEELILECGTEEALLNEPNEDRRLSDPHHREVWLGELGMSHVWQLGRPSYWRSPEPAVSGGGGYGGGRGGGGEVNSY